MRPILHSFWRFWYFQIVNPLNELEGPERIPVSSLVGIPVPGTPVPHPALAPNADKKFYLGMDLERLESHHFNGDPNDPGLAMGQPWQRLQAQVDKINLALPPSPPLTQLDDLPEVRTHSSGVPKRRV